MSGSQPTICNSHANMHGCMTVHLYAFMMPVWLFVHASVVVVVVVVVYTSIPYWMRLSLGQSATSTSASTSQKISAGIPIASQLSLKANKTLGLLRRTLSPCSKDVKARAYQGPGPSSTRIWSRSLESILIHHNTKTGNRYRKRLHVLYIVTTGEAHLPLRSF